MRRWLAYALAGAAMPTLAGLGIRALGRLPGAGAVPHPYGSRAVTAALGHATENAVASVTLDQRGFDTLGEEMILLAAATGTVLLLRQLSEESRQESAHGYGPEDVFEAVRLVGYLLLPLTLLVGAYVVLHGHLSPGGGFQGGTILASGLYLTYLAADYRAVDRLRAPGLVDTAEGAGAFAYVAVGLSGLLAGSGFLANWLPKGTAGSLLSSGTVPLLNIAIGVEVGSAFVLIVAKFLEQALLVPEDVAEED